MTAWVPLYVPEFSRACLEMPPIEPHGFLCDLLNAVVRFAPMGGSCLQVAKEHLQPNLREGENHVCREDQGDDGSLPLW
jgi:hypothetical protein